ncbi:MAG: hypothetical protein ACP5PB_09380 [Acidimicrobiales bacterium]
MGLIKTSLMLTVEVMAANLRLVREWAKRTGENSDPLHEPFLEDLGFEEIDSRGNVWPAVPGGPSPPGSLPHLIAIASLAGDRARSGLCDASGATCGARRRNTDHAARCPPVAVGA